MGKRNLIYKREEIHKQSCNCLPKILRSGKIYGQCNKCINRPLVEGTLPQTQVSATPMVSSLTFHEADSEDKTSGSCTNICITSISMSEESAQGRSNNDTTSSSYNSTASTQYIDCTMSSSEGSASTQYINCTNNMSTSDDFASCSYTDCISASPSSQVEFINQVLPFNEPGFPFRNSREKFDCKQIYPSLVKQTNNQNFHDDFTIYEDNNLGKSSGRSSEYSVASLNDENSCLDRNHSTFNFQTFSIFPFRSQMWKFSILLGIILLLVALAFYGFKQQLQPRTEVKSQCTTIVENLQKKDQLESSISKTVQLSQPGIQNSQTPEKNSADDTQQYQKLEEDQKRTENKSTSVSTRQADYETIYNTQTVLYAGIIMLVAVKALLYYW